MKFSSSSFLFLSMTASAAAGEFAPKTILSGPKDPRDLSFVAPPAAGARRQLADRTPMEACEESLWSSYDGLNYLRDFAYYFEDACTCHDSLDSIGGGSIEVSTANLGGGDAAAGGTDSISPEGAFLSCSKPEYLFCDSEIENCASKFYLAHFDTSGELVSRTFTYDFVEGIDDELMIKINGLGSYDESGYSDLDGVTCEASLNGNACAVCEVGLCEVDDEFSMRPGWKIDCGEGNTVDQCSNGYTLGEGVFGVLNTHEYHQPLRASQTPQSMCEEMRYDSANCVCEPVPGDKQEDDYMLMCDYDCAICNQDETVCGHQINGVRITKYGKVFCEMSGFRYTKGPGLSGTTTTVEYMFDPANGDHVCFAAVNGERCGTCDIIDYSDTCHTSHFLFESIQVQCEAVTQDPTLINSCTTESTDGPFSFVLASTFTEYEGCYHEVPNVTQTIRSVAAAEAAEDKEKNASPANAVFLTFGAAIVATIVTMI